MGLLNDRFLFTSGKMKFGSSEANRWDTDAREGTSFWTCPLCLERQTVPGGRLMLVRGLARFGGALSA